MKSTTPLDPQAATRPQEQELRLEFIIQILDTTVEALDSRIYTCNPKDSNTNLAYLILRLQDAALDVKHLYLEEHSALEAAEKQITNLHIELANANMKDVEARSFLQSVSTEMENASDELIKMRRSLAITEAENEELDGEIAGIREEKKVLETASEALEIELERVRLENAELRIQPEMSHRILDLHFKAQDLMLGVSQDVDGTVRRRAKREELTRLIENITREIAQQETDEAEEKRVSQEAKTGAELNSTENGQKSWRNCWGFMMNEKDRAEVNGQDPLNHLENFRKKEEKAYAENMRKMA